MRRAFSESIVEDAASRGWSRCIANAQVVAEGDTPVFSAVFKPLLVGAIRWKKIVMPLDGEAGGREDIGKALA
jgi:hypothetical protein